MLEKDTFHISVLLSTSWCSLMGNKKHKWPHHSEFQGPLASIKKLKEYEISTTTDTHGIIVLLWANTENNLYDQIGEFVNI